MSTELATRNTTTELTITPAQGAFTDVQLHALAQIGVDTNRPGDVAVFFHQAKRTGLDPFNREIYMITRKGKPTIQTGIDGFYKIADRSVRASGGTWGIPETLWCGEDGKWTDVWLSKKAPAAAKVTVERDGAKFTTVAVTEEYRAQGPMWDKMPARMIAKCAEALAIRRAFPDALSGLYTSEEMAQADHPVQAPQAPTPQQGGSRIQQARQRAQSRPVSSDPSPAGAGPEMCTPELWAALSAALQSAGYESTAAGVEAIQEQVGRALNGPAELTAQEARDLTAFFTQDPTAEPVQGELVEDQEG